MHTHLDRVMDRHRQQLFRRYALRPAALAALYVAARIAHDARLLPPTPDAARVACDHLGSVADPCDTPS